MYADMELWAEIRRRVLTGEISKRQACRVYHIHWATLRKVLAHEEPPGYRRTRPPRRPTIEPVLPIIRQILADDTTAPKKQRHTAYRIWQRLRDEHGFTRTSPASMWATPPTGSASGRPPTGPTPSASSPPTPPASATSSPGYGGAGSHRRAKELGYEVRKVGPPPADDLAGAAQARAG
ncbi:hypothetical protein [Urbifossiella limnaea]|uniref:Uncharacterized protein n=1 Tax=Urbifossiella limnaea TaxID=2528023 RepID=A0A517XWK1_9BACT|nr:hypothetical protein [Urbifossiella limnaea]QDU21868.1 hypothetical protein ETAA1_38410 [Urbifossiella limnaea]